MSEASKKADPPLERVLCIYYPMHFKKDQAQIQAFIDSKNEVNKITSAYTAKLSFKV